jgi:cytochrome c oxidase subunit 3
VTTALQDAPQISTGGGDWQSIEPPNAALLMQGDHSPEPSRTGIWVALSAITMSFAAFTSALFVSQGSAVEWKHIVLPSILYVNTLVLLVSSISLEIGRKRIALFARGESAKHSAAALWLAITLFLGLLFVTGQYLAWLRLKSAGLYLATTLTSSFFYVLTAMHALHVLGGLTALVVVIRRFYKPAFSLRKSTLDSTAYYWHFMTILWMYLLGILWLKL